MIPPHYRIRYRVTVACLLALAIMPVAHARTVVVFRYDGFMGRQVNETAFGKSENRFKADETALQAFIARKLPVTVALTPYCNFPGQERVGPLSEDEPRMKLLREACAAGVCEPALYGVYTAHATDGFVGRYGAAAIVEIARAKSDVESWLQRPLEVLVPPRGLYDGESVGLAYDGGIRILSDGPGPDVYPIQYVTACGAGPIPVDALSRAAAYPEDGLVVVVVRPSDFKANDLLGTAQFDAASFGAYLDAIAGTPGVEVLPMSSVVTKYPDLVSGRHQRAFVSGREMLKAGKLYQPLTKMIWRDRPADVAWATSVWEPLSSKRYLPHAALGLLGLALAALAWVSPLRRDMRLRLLLVLAPAAGCMAVAMSSASRGHGIGLNAQAAMVGLGVAALYGVLRYADMIMLQMRRLNAQAPTRK